MSETKFTPGPWTPSIPRVEDEHSCGHKQCAEHPLQTTGSSIHAGSAWVADVLGEHVGIPLEQFKANRLLIAAAPDLYAALKGIIDSLGKLPMPVREAEAALALADGTYIPDLDGDEVDHEADMERAEQLAQ